MLSFIKVTESAGSEMKMNNVCFLGAAAIEKHKHAMSPTDLGD